MKRHRTSQRKRRRLSARVDPIVGLVVVVALIAFVYISYTADSGLPLQRSYHITVQLPNADRLINTDEVRIAGIRVGQVSSVSAERSRAGGQPYATVGLSLSPSTGPLPADTHVEVGAASVLGQTYVDLMPGTSAQTIRNGGTLPLRNASSTVELTDLLDIFNHSTGIAIQNTLGGFGAGVAGRGTALNSTIAATTRLLPPLTNLASTLASTRANLALFLHGVETVAGALAPVSAPLADLITNGSVTFTSLATVRAALAATIDDAPGAESSATRALIRLASPLNALAAATVRLHAAGPALPRTLSEVNSTLTAGDRPLTEIPPFASRLRVALHALASTSRAPTTVQALTLLHSATSAATPLLAGLTPAQTVCNVIGIWGPNFASTFGSIGVGQGPSIANIGLTTLGAKLEELQHAAPAPNIAINYQPNENANECESGNEPYNGTQQLSNPPGDQSTSVPQTAPPAGVLQLARNVGLLNSPAGTPR